MNGELAERIEKLDEEVTAFVVRRIRARAELGRDEAMVELALPVYSEAQKFCAFMERELLKKGRK